MTLVEIMMAICARTAAYESGFTLMNLEKTSQRTQMRPDTLDYILRITELLLSNLI